MSVSTTQAEGDWAGRFVPDGALPLPGPDATLGARLAPYIDWQAACWPRLAAARAGLAAVRTKALAVGGRRVLAQFNPGRVVNTTARIDAATIRARPCFLCPANLPEPEKGLAFGSDWVLLANPAPILPQHLVLAHREHRPQRARDAVDALVALAQATRGHAAVIFNGPACGASAPDHLHLQAVGAGLLPGEVDAWAVVGGAPAQRFVEGPGLFAWIVPPPGPAVLGFWGEPRAVARAVFAATDAVGEVQAEHDEPRLNLLAAGRDDGVLALVFPRERHRPACYHAEDPQRLLVSPGSIDMAGLMVTVRPRDFDRLDARRAEIIYRETSMGLDRLAQVRELLCRRLAHV